MSEQCQEEVPATTDEQLIDLSATSTSTEHIFEIIMEINTEFSVCEPLSSSNTPEISHTEHDALLDDVENAETAESCETNMFKCSGDNWGLSWTQLLVFSLLLSFAGPIIYILYIAEYSAKTNITALEGTYIDKKCPFTGNASIRGRILIGIVQKLKMQRTTVIRRDYLHYIRKYNRFEKRHRNMSISISALVLST